MKRKVPLWLLVFLGAVIASVIIAIFHQQSAIISFDEGFHGGGALFLNQAFHHYILQQKTTSISYLLGEFANGITLYPPLWAMVAAGVSLVFGPTTEVFRLSTGVFYVASIMTVYFLVKLATKRDQPAVLSAAIVGTMPMVILYSNLMMLEVPQMWGVMAMVAGFFMYSNGLIPRNLKYFLLVGVVFLLGPLTKLPAIVVAWSIIGLFIALSSILFCRQRYYRNFLKPELLLFPIISFLGIASYILIEIRFLHVNMINFYIGQSQGSVSGNPLIKALYAAWQSREFYLRDFRHIPVMSTIWVGSVILYFLWKRTPFSILLVAWAFGVYACFSAVNPQVPQYIMSIYPPLAIGTALAISEITSFIKLKHLRLASTLLLTAVLVFFQIKDINKSEAYGWFSQATYQQEAADLLVSQAKPGDKVLVWHDGTTYVIQVAGLKKQLEIQILINIERGVLKTNHLKII